MTRNELARSMKVTPKTIFEWQKLGCPKKKVFINGIKWRWDFEVSATKEWLESQKGIK
jgi:hypothetical protein